MTPCDAHRMRGFTYLWMLWAVTFLSVSLALGVQIGATVTQRDKEKELLALGRQFRSAIGRYYETQLSAGKHEYPATLEDLLRDNRAPGIQRYLRKIFIDPMTGKAEWGLLRLNGRIVGVHSLSEMTPIKQEGFAGEDVALRQKQKYSQWVFTYPADLMLQAENGATTEVSANRETVSLTPTPLPKGEGL